MIFFYHPSAGEKKILLEEDFFRYLILSRRHRVGEKISVRNLEDKNLYEYEIEEIGKKKAILSFVGATQWVALTEQPKNIHLAWGICDLKTITKTLPFLNELGVKKISFIWCDRSQKQGGSFQKFLDEKCNKILISSCEQCGRTNLMELDIFENIEKFLENFPDTNILDFGGEKINILTNVEAPHWVSQENNLPFLIGPEGGFTDEERKIFNPKNIISFDTSLVLRSETAVVKIASMM